MSEGDIADAPVPRQWVQGWRIGKPDLVLESPVIQNIPASGTVPYRYVIIQNTEKEDRWISAMEIRPSAPQVVHHLLVFMGPPNTDRKAAAKTFLGGLNGYFAGMVPGQGAITFPEGTAKLLPKGATLVFQIHYTTNGAAAQDKPRIGFKFAPKPPDAELATRAAANRFFAIPANDPNFAITGSHTFFLPTRLISLNPHSHVRGKAFKYELFYPDGKSEVILNIPRYDFNWQMEYTLAKPLMSLRAPGFRSPAGTTTPKKTPPIPIRIK